MTAYSPIEDRPKLSPWLAIPALAIALIGMACIADMIMQQPLAHDTASVCFSFIR
jgi:hypothetical protein